MKYDAIKIIRLFIAGLIFLSLTSIQGMDSREVQQAMFTIACMLVFSLLIRNVWLTLFMWWTAFLFIYFRFQGMTYFFNIFFGCLLYFLTKISYKKEHINHYIKIFIIFTGINMLYMLVQYFDLDFYYYLDVVRPDGQHFTYDSFKYMCGFMGNQANMSVLAALSIPLLATRRSKWAVWASLLLFIPICTGHTSSALIAGAIGLLFVLFFRLNRRIWWSLIVIGTLLASLYVVKCDIPMGMMNTRPKMWKVVMRDAVKHPVVGYGLDSFRNFTETKRQKYCDAIDKTSVGWHLTVWDNPHNILVTLAFEFGILIWLLLIGYLREYILAFRRCVKDRNTLATTGFLMVFFIVSMGHFPICLAAMAVFIIPMFALAEKSVGLYE